MGEKEARSSRDSIGKQQQKEERVGREKEEEDTNAARAKKQSCGEESSVRSFIFEIVKFAVIALLIVIPFRIFIAQPYIVSGASMAHTLESGTYLIVDQLSYRFDAPERGDVIIFRFPQEPSKFFIKRIIGLPRETVTVREGVVTITNADDSDSFVLPEPYLDDAFSDTLKQTLGKDEYFVMGDNRRASLDSRIWGTLPRSHIVGRAFMALFPLTEIALFPGEYRFAPEKTK